MSISHLADVHPDAQLDPSVIVEPFASIEADVKIGANTVVERNSVIMNGTRIGSNCRIFPSAVIGAIPQDLKFQGEYTEVFIGNNTTIREFVTINRATNDQKKTVIGNNCLLMAYVHVAHDCQIGNNCIISNVGNLAGHVVLEDWVILEGLVAVQQFVRIGAHAFVAGASLVRKNIPPYIKAAREPLSFMGVNVVGLRRRGFAEDCIKEIEKIYKTIFIQNANVTKALKAVESRISLSTYRSQIINFITNSPKGIIKGYSS